MLFGINLFYVEYFFIISIFFYIFKVIFIILVVACFLYPHDGDCYSMNIKEREKKNFHFLDIRGKINRLQDSINLKTLFQGLLDKDINYIALNLADVTYLDSGALNVIIFIYNALLRKSGKLVIISPNEFVKDTLEIVGINRIVKIYSTEEDFDNDKEIV